MSTSPSNGLVGADEIPPIHKPEKSQKNKSRKRRRLTELIAGAEAPPTKKTEDGTTHSFRENRRAQGPPKLRDTYRPPY